MKYDTVKIRRNRQNVIDTRKKSVKQRDMARKQARTRKYVEGGRA
jgi:ribosomal protein S1